MAHDHDHAHDHHRDVGRRRLLIVLAFTAVYMVVEFVGGLMANSLALMADAGHMLSDVAALGLSAFAMWFAARPATEARTYGWLRFEILAALINGVTLVVIALLIYWHAWRRLMDPPEVAGGLMLGVASVGLLVNLMAAAMLHASAGHSHNVRGAYLHVLGDLLGSVGAIGAAAVILWTGWTPADPIISAVVATLILVGSWRLVRESTDILLEAVPRHVDLPEVRAAILEVPRVEAVRDLHVWTLTSGFHAMSCHVQVRDPAAGQEVIRSIHERMHHDFGIEHVTIQIDHPRIYRIGDEPV